VSAISGKQMTIAKQPNPAAAFVLREAAAAGLKIGTDGTELVLVAPLSMPRESRLCFEQALFEHQRDVIALIMAENAR
jgi:hypothetical protein